MNHPLHGEVWEVRLDPTLGEEIQKTRPAVVLSGRALMNQGVRIVVPVTGWKEESMVRRPWFVRLAPDELNGLDKESAATCHHIRSLSLERFLERKGRLGVDDLDEIKAALIVSMDINLS